MSTSLPIFDDSSCFMRVDMDRVDIFRGMIVGPAETPYRNGCFVFDIFCPADYPTVAPQCNIITTGNGTVRFNPNLYDSGKVCLSLLGTWPGGVNEQWNEKTSTLEQVMVSIQSLIMVPEPYYNEPSYESSMNTPSGDRESRLYNEQVKINNIRWAMIEQLRNPCPGFEDVILHHFTLKRQELMDHMGEWIIEAKEFSSDSFQKKLEKLVLELYELLFPLDKDVPLKHPLMKDEEPEPQIDEEMILLVTQLADIVPGYSEKMYIKALSINDNDLNTTVFWLFEAASAFLEENPGYT